MAGDGGILDNAFQMGGALGEEVIGEGMTGGSYFDVSDMASNFGWGNEALETGFGDSASYADTIDAGQDYSSDSGDTSGMDWTGTDVLDGTQAGATGVAELPIEPLSPYAVTHGSDDLFAQEAQALPGTDASLTLSYNAPADVPTEDVVDPTLDNRANALAQALAATHVETIASPWAPFAWYGASAGVAATALYGGTIVDTFGTLGTLACASDFAQGFFFPPSAITSWCGAAGLSLAAWSSGYDDNED